MRWRQAHSRPVSRQECPATPCSRRGVTSASRRVGRQKESRICSSSVAATSCGEERTLLPFAGVRMPRSPSPPSVTPPAAVNSRSMTSSGRGGGAPPAASASRFARTPSSRIARSTSLASKRPQMCWQIRLHGSRRPAHSPMSAVPSAGATSGRRPDPCYNTALLLAERCGARALAERTRVELRAAGGRSTGHRDLGVRAIDCIRTQSRGARGGRAQQPRDRAGVVRHPQDRRDSPRQRLSQARHLGTGKAAALVGREPPGFHRMTSKDDGTGTYVRNGRAALHIGGDKRGEHVVDHWGVILGLKPAGCWRSAGRGCRGRSAA